MSVLSDTERQALLDALDDEYYAWATYNQVIRDFGAMRPFTNILESEARHIDMLASLFRRYGLEMPENTWRNRAPRFDSIFEACEAAIKAEINNASLYDRLKQSTKHQDILAVFDRLRHASQERHLPAFRRCAARR